MRVLSGWHYYNSKYTDRNHHNLVSFFIINADKIADCLLFLELMRFDFALLVQGKVKLHNIAGRKARLYEKPNDPFYFRDWWCSFITR
jgi:hypothetical protein